MVAHDDRAGDLVALGRTSFGTPVLVNRLVAGSDYVLGIGGVCPQHSTGFGGGAKLALGVLGRRSIRQLHYGHPSMSGALDVDNDFRRDLGEIARMFMRSKGVIPLLHAAYSWDEILERVAAEHAGRSELRAAVYPCAPLQIVGTG